MTMAVGESSDDKSRILEAFASIYPSLRYYLPRPIKDYAAFLYDFKRTSQDLATRAQAFEKLLYAIKRASCRAGLSPESATSICSEFASRPVLQTGPHLMLSIDPDAYYSHMFSLLGLMAHGAASYISYAVSTVSLAEKSRRGPGWPVLQGAPVNLFGISQNQLKSQSLLSRCGPYELKLEADYTTEPETVGWLRGILPVNKFETPACAIKCANRLLWPWVFSRDMAMLQIDDEDIADLVIDHLSDESSWLHQRLFQGHLAERIVAEVSHLALGPWAGWLGKGTDLFWHYDRKGRRRPLRLINETLVDSATGLTVARVEATQLCQRLNNRTLIPNLFLMFIVTAILPGVRVLGGSRHPIYYPLMRYALSRALHSAGLDRDLRNALARDALPGAWGHRVIEGNRLDILASARKPGPLVSRDDQAAREPLGDACGSMSSFVADELWREFAVRLLEGDERWRGPEWAYSGDKASFSTGGNRSAGL